jgi:ABC-type dipeptide/oligopeptide/nickel transport system permease component
MYFVRRILRGIFILIAASAFAFILCDLAPGDFLSEVPLNPGIPKETIAAMREHYALDRPLYLKYASWVASVVRGEWGYSLAYGTPVAAILWSRAANTLLLTVSAGLVAWAVAIGLAMWSAAGASTSSRSLVRGGVAALVAIPDILLVLVLTGLAAQTQIMPVGGMTSPEFGDLSFSGKIWDLGRHLMLPVSALAISAIPQLFAHADSAIREALQSPFLTASRALGIPRRRLLYRYVLRSAVNPLISLFGFSIGALLSSSLVVEAVVGWPGIGRLLLDATLQRDSYVVIGAVMLSAVFVFAGNLLSDLLLYAADPRIRTE